MMPVLKKSKEMAKELRKKGITPIFRRPTNPLFSSRNDRVGTIYRGPSTRGGHNKTFLPKRLNNNGPISKKPMYNRMISLKGHPGLGGSTAAAAEACLADYMRTMQHQLPPMPYDFPGFRSSIQPTLPRYYDGIPARAPIIPDYPPPVIPNRNFATSSNYDKRSYDEFIWKNKHRNGQNNRNRDSRDLSREHRYRR